MTAAKRLRWCCAVLLCVLAWPAWCQAPIPGYPDRFDAYDPREVALLPPYCMYSQVFRGKVPGGGDPDQIERWKTILGETYLHIHHYCWGLMKTNRGILLARSSQSREFYLADSIGEFDYVIDRSPRDFVLLPEILTKKGENLVLLGKGPVAVLMFEQAIDAKPDYWPPYARLGDYYAQVGERAKAIETIERGLHNAPDTPALVRRRSELLAAPGGRDGTSTKQTAKP